MDRRVSWRSIHWYNNNIFPGIREMNVVWDRTLEIEINDQPKTGAERRLTGKSSCAPSIAEILF
jgi:hypothetical protein